MHLYTHGSDTLWNLIAMANYAAFAHSFIYSFVYNEDAFAQVLKQGVSRVIIPESLVDQFDFSNLECSAFIDEGF